MNQKTITINGTTYDKQTGLPVQTNETATQARRSDARAVHQRTQRSTTLNRAYLSPRQKQQAKPVKQKVAVKVVEPTKQVSPTPKEFPKIQKFAPQPVRKTAPASAPTQAKNKVVADIAPTVHPMVQQVKAAKPQAQKAKTMPKPSEIIKAEATQEALAKAPRQNRSEHKRKGVEQRTKRQRFGRAMSFASMGTALLLIAGYFTYVNMPNLSVRVAAVQSGVDAQYPSYRPGGYSLNGRIAYDHGQVAMKFASNGTPQSFTLKQSQSGWNSTAVLDNYVKPLAGENYTTTTEGGLTVYSFDGNAAWVNNGILYTIEGDAPLSSDQIQKMAASL